MNFLALLLGLGVERALTRLFHLREFRWLDPLFDATFRFATAAPRAIALVELALVALLLVAPVGLLSVYFADESRPLSGLLFAVLVLLFSLGPRDLQEEVDDYCAAVAAGDAEATRRLTRELAEQAPAGDDAARLSAIERAICVQANNRMFGVVFWFLVLGPAAPAGAWLFRVVDLMRRRAVFAAPSGEALPAARTLHGLLAWLPGRLMAAAFALAGSFEGARKAWQARPANAAANFHERTEELIERVGRGAGEPGATGIMALVWRTLWLIWYPVIAIFTINDWLR